MSSFRDVRAKNTFRRAFTIIEMLVVISVIMILAGLIVSAVFRARAEARVTKCLNNLHQIGIALTVYAQHYGEGRPSGFPPWLTMLTTPIGPRTYLDDPRVLYCPDDPSRGSQGGRPDNMRYTSGEVIDQFETADIDPHSGPLNGAGPKNDTDGGKDCSYLFEYCGEPCDWIYNTAMPISPGAVGGVPEGYEWQWGTKPDWPTFLEMADADHNGVLSWNEVKVLSRKGDSKCGLRGWDIRVPIVRCYWHVHGQAALGDESLVLDLLGDANSVHQGILPWYK